MAGLRKAEIGGFSGNLLGVKIGIVEIRGVKGIRRY
jgi:hypothetical protein